MICLLVVLVKLSVLAKWLVRKTRLRKRNRGKGIVSKQPRPKSVYDFLGLFCCLTVSLYVCVVPLPYMIYIVLLWHDRACLCCTTPAAQHSSVSVANSTTVAVRVTGAVPSGLWQCHACRSTKKPARRTVMNAAARLVWCARKYEHITPLLRDRHWLPVHERIEFKLTVLVFHCLHGMASPYLANTLCRVADIDARRRLQFASASALITPSSRRSTVGDRAFFIAAPRIWNSLPSTVTASETLGIFKRWLKTHLFAA